MDAFYRLCDHGGIEYDFGDVGSTKMAKREGLMAMNPNLKRGSDGARHMTIREEFAEHLLTALVSAGFDPPIGSPMDARRASLAKEACLLADALIVGLADTRQTKVMVEEPSFYEEYAADMRRRGLQPRPPARKTEEELLRSIQDCPLAGTTWTHRKSGDTVYIDRAVIIEATAEPGVVYRHGWVEFVRPLAEFTAKFLPGSVVRRNAIYSGDKPVAAPPVSLDEADTGHVTTIEPPC